MPNVALIPDRATRIPVLEGLIDGYPNEEHKLVTDTGDSPLEDGAIITDHAVALAEILELEGSASSLTRGGFAHPEAAMDALRRLHKAVALIDVITPFGFYPEMILRECSAPPRGPWAAFQAQAPAHHPRGYHLS